MSLQESDVDLAFIDEYSSGDSNRTNPKICQEENNNDIDRLSKELNKMGCIVDAMQKPSNICVETFVHEEDSDSDGQTFTVINNEDDVYSDEFEEDKSDADAIKEEVVDNEDEKEAEADKIDMKLNKSNSSMSTNRPPPSTTSSVRSSNYGSIPVPKTNRINMSFSNYRLREIERQNHILLNKIVSARNVRKSSIPPQIIPTAPLKPVPAAALRRKRAQKIIDRDNMILLKKLQSAKSSSCSIRR